MKQTQKTISRNALSESIFYDTIVIGGNINAVVYACIHNHPIIINQENQPTKIDFFDSDMDLSAFGIKNNPRKLISDTSEKIVGTPHLHAWQRLKYYLSLSGNILIPHEIQTIHVDQNELSVFTKSPKKYKYSFNNLVVFGPEKIKNLDFSSSQEQKHTVYDWISIRTGGKHNFDFLETNDNFIKLIHFYQSDRDDVRSDFKDLVAISLLDEKQLNSPDFSDTMARFKIRKVMEAAGLYGTKNGLNPNYPDRSDQKYKYRPIKLEYERRQIKRGSDALDCHQDNVEYNTESLQAIVANCEKISQDNNYLRGINLNGKERKNNE
jgi:hypothetical protein